MANTINPRATLKSLAPSGITPKILEGYKSLTGDASLQAAKHISNCIKTGEAPVAVEDWVFCPHPACTYGSPSSLVSHIKAKHGSQAELAAELSKITKTTIFAEQIVVCSEPALAKYRLAGAKGTAGAKAKAEAREASAS